MLFNTLPFLIFFPLAAALHFALPHRLRWLFLLLSSYFFYACWNPAYLLLILFLTAASYFCARQIEARDKPSERKFFLAAAIIVSLGVLFTFKYFGFFTGSFRGLFGLFGIEMNAPALKLLLPAGISFYSFQAVGYVVDVYLGKCPASRSPGIFALFMSFFPQVAAGPIARAGMLLPQFGREKKFDPDRVASGLRLMLWGYYKKCVVADRLTIIVDRLYASPREYSGPALAAATVFFTFQIYCDFSGYSDIAIGAARVMGFRLMNNFDRPYHSASIPEFWRRWHISLSTWFRDYLYIPLGGNRVAVPRWYFNLLFVFVVSGLWHGAAWTFVFWGLIHGVFLVASVATLKIRGRISGALKLVRIARIGMAARRLSTFLLVAFAWIFFRADTFDDAFYIAGRVFTGWGHVRGGLMNLFPAALRYDALLGVISICIMEAVHLLQSRRPVGGFLADLPTPVRWAVYYAVIFVIVIFGEFGRKEFIYFQF